MPASSERKWLLIFYSVPSQPVANRMKIWRKLARVGAVPLKGSVYILPVSEEHVELCQWIISEVTSMGGEGAFVMTSRVETIQDQEIIASFNEARERNYRDLEKKIEQVERKIMSIKKGGGIRGVKGLADQVARIVKDHDELRKIDFFSAKTAAGIGKRVHALEAEIRKLSAPTRAEPRPAPSPRRIADYQNRIWITRKNPFVDRMASAWLIRHFIDPHARFDFIDEGAFADRKNDAVSFDISGGDFTHHADLCTFEVLVRSFSIHDRAVKKLAEIVHDLDIKDGKYQTPDAPGVEEILTGIRRTGKNDIDALERGIAVFEMLYVSKR